MLVLTRKEDQFILIGQDIEVRVVRISSDEVRLGIVAPRSVPVVRGELIEDIREETTTAAQQLKPDSHDMAKLAAHLRQQAQTRRDDAKTP